MWLFHSSYNNGTFYQRKLITKGGKVGGACVSPLHGWCKVIANIIIPPQRSLFSHKMMTKFLVSYHTLPDWSWYKRIVGKEKEGGRRGVFEMQHERWDDQIRQRLDFGGSHSRAGGVALRKPERIPFPLFFFAFFLSFCSSSEAIELLKCWRLKGRDEERSKFSAWVSNLSAASSSEGLRLGKGGVSWFESEMRWSFRCNLISWWCDITTGPNTDGTSTLSRERHLKLIRLCSLPIFSFCSIFFFTFYIRNSYLWSHPHVAVLGRKNYHCHH